jgi:arylsulfatase A-like enzyme
MRKFILLMLLFFWVVIPSLSQSASTASVSGGSRSTPIPYYNVLVILMDDVGRDALGVDDAPYAQLAAIATPRIDQLRTQGVTLRNLYATPVCAASRAAIETGWDVMRQMLPGAAPSVQPQVNNHHPTWAKIINDETTGRPIYDIGFFGKDGLGPLYYPNATTYGANAYWNDTTTPKWPGGSAPFILGEEQQYPFQRLRVLRNGYDYSEGIWGTGVGYGAGVSDNEYYWVRADRELGADPNDARTWWDLPCLSNGTVDRTTTHFPCSDEAGEVCSSNQLAYILNDSGGEFWQDAGNTTVLCDDYVMERTTDAAITFIEKNARIGNPWIAYIGYNSVHNPQDDPALMGSRYCVGTPSGGLAPDSGCPALDDPDGGSWGTMAQKRYYHMDREINRILDIVDETRTIVLVFGDNGTVLGHSLNTYATGKTDGTEPGYNVGGILWGGPVTRANIRSEANHSVTDIHPMMLEVAGVSAPATLDTVNYDARYNGQAASFSGTSLMKTVRNQAGKNQGNLITRTTYTGVPGWISGEGGASCRLSDYRTSRYMDIEGARYKLQDRSCCATTDTRRFSTIDWSDEDVEFENLCLDPAADEWATEAECVANLTGAQRRIYNTLLRDILEQVQYTGGGSATLATCAASNIDNYPLSTNE